METINKIDDNIIEVTTDTQELVKKDEVKARINANQAKIDALKAEIDADKALITQMGTNTEMTITKQKVKRFINETRMSRRFNLN